MGSEAASAPAGQRARPSQWGTFTDACLIGNGVFSSAGGESAVRPIDRLREIPFWYVPFDVLRVFDLPQLLAASHAAGLSG